MDDHTIIAGVALLAILAAWVGLTNCPCDDESCTLAHREHQDRAHQAQLRDIHQTYHSVPQPDCAYCPKKTWRDYSREMYEDGTWPDGSDEPSDR